MMKIVFINSLSELYGSTIRCRYIVRCFREMGYEVLYSESSPTTCSDCFVVDQPESSTGYLMAIRDRISFIKRVSPFDLLYISKLNPLTAPLILWASHQNVPFVVDWDDMDSHFQRTRFREMLTRAVEKSLVRKLTHCTTHSDEIASVIQRKSSTKVHIIPQCIDTDLFDPNQYLRERERRRLLLSPSDVAIVVTLTFTQGGARDLDLLIDAVELLENREKLAFRLYLVGDGPSRHRFMEQAKARGISSLFWLGRVPLKEVARILSAMDLGLVLMRKDLGNKYRFSLKTLEYLAMGLPVIGSLTGQTETALGHLLESNVTPDPQSLAQAIAQWYRESWAQSYYHHRDSLTVQREAIISSYSLKAMSNALSTFLERMR